MNEDKITVDKMIVDKIYYCRITVDKMAVDQIT